MRKNRTQSDFFAKAMFVIAWILATGAAWGLGHFSEPLVVQDLMLAPELVAGIIKKYLGISIYGLSVAVSASIFAARLIYLLCGRARLAWRDWLLPSARCLAWIGVLTLAFIEPTRGSLSGVTQWLVLRHQLPKIGWWWILSSTVAPLPIFFFGIPKVGYFSTEGIAIGVLQSLILRHHVRQAGWWILATSIGWTIGLESWSYLGWSYIEEINMLTGDLLWDMLISILAVIDIFRPGIIGGAIAGFVAGTGFVCLQHYNVWPNPMQSFKFIRVSLVINCLLLIPVIAAAIPLYRELESKYIQSYLLSEHEPLELTRLEVIDGHKQLIWAIENATKTQIRFLEYGVVPSGFMQRYPTASEPRGLQKGEHLLVSYTASTHSAELELWSLKKNHFRVGFRTWSYGNRK